MCVVPDSRCSTSWGIACDARREIRRQSERLVKRVGVQRLRAAAVAAIASMQVRTTLLNTSSAASDQPEVCVCARRASERGDFGSNGFTSFAHSMRAARCFATSMK